MNTFENVSKEELISRSAIPISVVADENAIYQAMASDMLQNIKACKAKGKNTVFIVPVGPIGQYEILAKAVNEEKISLQDVVFINMDEYLTQDDIAVALDSPLSFEGFMEREFHSKIEPKLSMPKENRIFPRVGREGEIAQLIEKLGGVDVAYGGIGINGHIAFNEPPEPNEQVSNEQFAALCTRRLTLSRETRTINAVTAAFGYIDYIPTRCITVGMSEILAARRIRFYMNRVWQRGIVRKIALGGVSCSAPASYFARHSDALITITEQVALPPVTQLR